MGLPGSSDGGILKTKDFYQPDIIRKTNLGIELGLFGDLTLIADLFEDRRNDIFMTRRSVPASSGFQESK